MDLRGYIGEFVKLRNGLKAYIGYEMPSEITYSSGEPVIHPFIGIIFSRNGHLAYTYTDASWGRSGKYRVVGKHNFDVVDEWHDPLEIINNAFTQNSLVVHPCDGKFEILGKYQGEYLLKNVVTAKISKLSDISFTDNWKIERVSVE